MRSISTRFRKTLARVGNAVSFQGILSGLARYFEHLDFPAHDWVETGLILVFY
jgi:hypothetical protein